LSDKLRAEVNRRICARDQLRALGKMMRVIKAGAGSRAFARGGHRRDGIAIVLIVEPAVVVVGFFAAEHPDSAIPIPDGVARV
jgi:hypothetical protein